MPSSTAVATLCPKCGQKPIPEGFVMCFSCVVTLDEAAQARLARERDELAEWLLDADEAIQKMEDDHPKKAARRALWEIRLKNYEAMVFLTPVMREGA